MTGAGGFAVDGGSQKTESVCKDEPHGYPDAGSGNAPMSELVRLLGARKVLQPNERSETAVSDEQRRQMWHNVKGFFDTLSEWAEREVEANENAAKRRDNNEQ